MRMPLIPGTVIEMPGGASYTLGEVLGEGGFSIVYRASTAGSHADVVIKEFFPAVPSGNTPIARRDERGRVCPAEGQEKRFGRLLARFESEGAIGGLVAGDTYQTIPFLASGSGYAVMQRESSDMTSVEALTASWTQHPPLPYSGQAQDRDPVFTDLPRVSYALRVSDSMLSALETVHQKGFLHLDLSARNVLWAGREQAAGRNCSAILTDFGCAVPLTDGVYLPHPEQPLSFSPGFDPPEVRYSHEALTPASDVYAAGVLLLYLCCGPAALDMQNFRLPFRFIQQQLDNLRLPPTVRETLLDLICRATERRQASRYPSAAAMQEAVRALLNSLPAHPINPDTSDAFTLHSLRSMLEGSLDTHYSWADELCDRRGLTRSELPDGLHEGLSFRVFDSDEDFLRALLPQAVIAALCSSADCAPGSIMACNYPNKMKEELCRLFQRIGMRELIVKCNALLDGTDHYTGTVNALWPLLNTDGDHLRSCMQRIRAWDHPAAGMAMLALYALLGKDLFARMTSSAGAVDRLFPRALLLEYA